MIGWAKTQAGVKAIVASTDKDNPASFSVLQKNGFIRCGETEGLLHWRLDLVK
jgi:RimJ/RimL family protein N-acetyltransferase